MITIAIDAMGGDHGVDITVPAAIKAVQHHSDLQIILVGNEAILREKIGNTPNINIHPATEVVAMDEAAASALRGKKDSSMRVAINLVKEQRANAAVSAGNTGALMATARFVLKMIKGIERPAICTALPTIQRPHSWVMDLGANVDSSAEHLLQFALMGNALLRAVDENPSPSIGLLNIGEEETKGNESIKTAAQLIGATKLNYYGFVEGDDIYKGTVDLVVTDGFAGNVALKSSEGVAKMITHFITAEFTRNIFTKILGLLARPPLKAFKRRIDPRIYNGACLLGLNGIVVKSHGGTDAFGFEHAISVAYNQAKHDFLGKITQEMAKVLQEEQS
jgi:phosphate acyltransferase